MPAQLTTNLDFSEDTETVVITRVQLGGSDGMDKIVTTVYDGPGDLQYKGGSVYISPDGPNDNSEAVIVIDPLPDGTLPAVHIDDNVAVNGVNFVIVLVEMWLFTPKHLELRVNRGTVQYQGSPR